MYFASNLILKLLYNNLNNHSCFIYHSVLFKQEWLKYSINALNQLITIEFPVATVSIIFLVIADVETKYFN